MAHFQEQTTRLDERLRPCHCELTFIAGCDNVGFIGILSSRIVHRRVSLPALSESDMPASGADRSDPCGATSTTTD